MAETPCMVRDMLDSVLTWEDEILVYDGNVLTYNSPYE